MRKIYFFLSGRNVQDLRSGIFLWMNKYKKIVVSSLILLFSCITNTYAQGPGAGWEYYRTINLSAGTPLADFQLKITIPASQNAHINTDGSDLRFYDNTGAAAYNYFIEKWNPAGVSVVWVKLPSINTNSLRMYYGNPAAATLSDGLGVFDFFDGFDGAPLNPAKWTNNSSTGSGTVSVGGGHVSLNNTGAKTSIYASITSPSPSFVIEIKHKEPSYYRNRFYATDVITTAASNRPAGTSEHGYFGVGPNQPTGEVNYSGGTGKILSANIYYLTGWNITDNGTNTTYYNWFTKDFDSEVSIYDKTIPVTALIRYLNISVTDGIGSTMVDWARVRKDGSAGTVSLGTEVSTLPAAPVISGLSSQNGCVGTHFTINGSNFSSAFLIVTINGTPLSSFTINGGGTQIDGIIAAGTSGLIKVSNGAGTATWATSFTVNPLPVANAGPAISPICQGATSGPLGGSFGAPAVSAVWDDGGAGGTFGNNGGTTPGTATYTASVTAAASVNLNLTTSGGVCTNAVDSKTITVNPIPAGTVTVSPNSVCAGDPITFTAPTGYKTYTFLVEGYNVQNGNSNIFAPTNLKTTDIVKVLVSTTKVCSATFDAPPFTVNAYPIGTLVASESSDIDNDNKICAGDLVSFQFNFPNPNYSKYKFILNNNNTVLQDEANPTYSTSALTNGASVSVEVTGPGGCTKTFGPIVITVNDLPVGTLIAKEGVTISDNIICAGEDVEFTATPGFSNYDFQVNGLSTQNGTSALFNTISLVNGDEVSVIVKNTNGCFQTLGPITFVVNDKPSIPTISHNTPITFCAGESVVLSSTLANSYQWNLNGTPISGANSANYVATTAGNYSVTVSNVSGCSATSAPTTVIVNALPGVPTITASGATSFCIGGNVTLTSSAANSFQWYKDGVIINGETGLTHLATTSGDYTVVIKNVNGCSNTSLSKVVTVNPLPSTPIITADGPTTFCAGEDVPFTSTLATTYQWFKDGITIPSATSRTYLANSAGNYTVKIADGNSCYATSGITNVIVNPLPIPTLTGPNPICPDTEKTYITESGMTDYVWTFSGGIRTGGGQNTDNQIKILWSVPGPKSVEVNYKNQFGCTASKSQPVTTSTNPLPSINKTGPANNIVCNNSTGLKYTTETGNSDYTWSISSGGTIESGLTTNEVTVNWQNAGPQWISVNYKNTSGCEAAAPTVYNVTVNPLPKGKFSYLNTPYCSNGSDPLPTMETGGKKGFFSSTTGLVFINTSTGAIDLSASTPGTYLVTNTIAAGAGCEEVKETNSITITALPVATINYGGTPFCTSVTTGQPVTLNGNGGTFSLTADLSIDGTNGTIIPSSSTPGNYTVTYKIPSANGCGEVTATTPVIITALPTVNISYSNTDFCKSDGVKIVSRTGTGAYTEGTYSALAGLVIHRTSGDITPASSTPGTYIVTYATQASVGCGIVYDTTSVTITAVPTASITYTGTPFCTTGTSADVNLSGTGAYKEGIYSSTSGLIIDPSSGMINPSASTPGNYTVTYTIPSSGGCAAIPVTTPVTISQAPSVNAGTEIITCANGGAVNITAGSSVLNTQGNVTWAGGSGSWANANSLTLATYLPSAADIANGNVNLTLSALGDNGCSAVQATASKNLIINELPAPVVILPETSTLCIDGIQPLISVKTTATDANINRASGAINQTIPDNSTSGTYHTLNINNIPATAVITSVILNFNVTHPANGDLTINIKAANGKVLNIANALSGQNFINTIIHSTSANPIQTSGDTGPFTGTYSPQMRFGTQGATSVPGSNKAFARSFSELFSNPNGNWILSVRDGGQMDAGTFNSWSLTINYSVPVEPVPVTWLPVTDLYLDAAASILYTGDAQATVYAKANTTGQISYTATSTNSFACSVSKEVVLTVNPSPKVRIAADYCTNSTDGKIRLTAISTNPQSWNWSTGETTETVLVDIAHEYYVSVTNTSGCVGTDILSVAQELVTNGDFELGNTGFFTEYDNKPSPIPASPASGNTGLRVEGTYAVDTSANVYHTLFHGRDHTTSEQKGKFLMINGSKTPIGNPAHLRTIWEQTVVVQPNTDYYFSAWAMNLNGSPFARLQFEVNGVPVGTIADLSIAPVPSFESDVNINNWVRFYSNPKWNSGDTTTAVIRIINLNQSTGGLDFGLDDISFGTLSPFVSAPTEAGRDSQVVCVDNPILPITYKVGSGATGPVVDGLPVGFQSDFDGLNFTITGTPTTLGTFIYTVRTTGSCPNPSAATGTITVGANATINLTSSGNGDRNLCVNSNLTNNIIFSIAGGGTGVVYSGLPVDINRSYVNGVANISGSSALPGIYNYKIKTSGTCKQDSLSGVIKISAASNAGGVSAPTICLGETGNIGLTGYVGQILQWEVSNDQNNYTILSNTSNTQPFSGITQSTYYRVLVKNEVCDAVYSLPAALRIRNLWEGTFTADWSNPFNWSSGSLPDITKCNGTITIGHGVNHDPVLSGTAIIKDLNILPNGNLAITGGNLQVSGIITNNGILNAREGGVEYTGNSPQTIPAGLFLNNAINDLKISNTTATGLTILGEINVYRSVTFGTAGKNLNTNAYLTFKSTKEETAWLGNMTGKTIKGDATVERFINTGTEAGAHPKSWQLLAVPTVGQTIKQAWQEGATATNINSTPGSAGNPHPGYGTLLTSNVPDAANQTGPGFDAFTAPGPSIKIYNSVTNGYDGPSSTANLIYNPKGYMILVRGDRSVFTFNAPAKPTVLRTKGKLFTPNNLPTPVSVTTGKMQSVGNPYASAINIRNLSFGSGISPTIFVWDPTLTTQSAYGLGAFQTLYLNGGNYVNLLASDAYGPSGTANNFIQSGQAFIIQAAGSSSGGTLVFKESDKANGSKLLFREPAPATSKDPQIKVNLYSFVSGTPVIVDGALTQFGESYSNDADENDVRKMQNTSENLSIRSDNKNLVIERRLPVVSSDTLFYEIRNVRVQPYRLEFITNGLPDFGIEGWVEDYYLKTKIPLNPRGTTVLDYTIENKPGSYAANRFRIIFKKVSATLPVTFTNIKAIQEDAHINVSWNVENERQMLQYEVEASFDGNQFNKIGTVTAINSGKSNYSFIDKEVISGYHYYRVRGVDKNDQISYTRIVKVLVAEKILPSSIGIYPNPITNGVVNLQLMNQPAGKYGIRLLNPVGQVIVSKQITLAGGNHTEKINWDYKLAHGLYQLEVKKPDGGIHIIIVKY